jgi:hypothetical protein
MKKILMPIVLTALLVFMAIRDFMPNSPWGLGFVRNAEAIIGMPRTPLSYAGVARRSMYRGAAVATTAAVTSAAAANAAAANMAAANAAAAQAAAANTAAAQTAAANAAAATAAAQNAAAALPIGATVPYLPPGCGSTLINGVNYFNCGGVYYRAGFQGNSVVYIVSAPWGAHEVRSCIAILRNCKTYYHLISLTIRSRRHGILLAAIVVVALVESFSHRRLLGRVLSDLAISTT